MNPLCERIEALLPEFVEGGLAAEDAARVKTHVDSCPACREALAAYTVLEESLVSRRSEVPDVDDFLPSLAAERVPALHSPLVRAFRAMMSLPGISILLTMWAAMFALSFRTHVADDLSRYSSLDRWKAMVEFVAVQITALTGDNVWVLSAVYLALTLAILGSVGAMTLRYVRR